MGVRLYEHEFTINRNSVLGRKAAYILALGDVAFSDFGVDEDGRLYLLRISFDGYGCCTPDHDAVTSMSARDSQDLIERMGSDELLDTDHVRTLLRRYFEAHRAVLWEDALVEWGLVSK